MVGILLKIGKQSENVGEEEVFGRFCICDVTENPSGGLLRRISTGGIYDFPARRMILMFPCQINSAACAHNVTDCSLPSLASTGFEKKKTPVPQTKCPYSPQ